MPNLLIALAILFLGWHALRFFGRAKPQVLVRAVKMAGSLAAFGVAALLFLRGHTEFALGLAGVGVWLSGWGAPPQWFERFGLEKFGLGKKRPRLRSAMIEMDIDPATGAMQGLVLAGELEGRQLGALTQAQCEALYRACLSGDPDGARLLEAYLDRRFAGWRDAGERYTDAGGGRLRARQTGVMTEDEAYEVLGLQQGAPRDEITRAHHALMKKLHPDHGGTTSLAARVNEAKDVLMRRHQ